MVLLGENLFKVSGDWLGKGLRGIREAQPSWITIASWVSNLIKIIDWGRLL